MTRLSKKKGTDLLGKLESRHTSGLALVDLLIDSLHLVCLAVPELDDSGDGKLEKCPSGSEPLDSQRDCKRIVQYLDLFPLFLQTPSFGVQGSGLCKSVLQLLLNQVAPF